MVSMGGFRPEVEVCDRRKKVFVKEHVCGGSYFMVSKHIFCRGACVFRSFFFYRNLYSETTQISTV